MKKALKGITPHPVWKKGSDIWYGLQRASQWSSSRFHPLRRKSIKQLASYNDIHKDRRCFIIGNGPSLKNTDLSKLRDEYTFGMNRIYLIFPELGFTTSYYLSVNSLVIEQCAEDIINLPIPRFLSWRSHKHLQNPEGITFLHTTYSGPKFARDARERLWEGATVTYVALQLAYYMGFKQVILIGVDHSFNTKGTPNKTVVSTGDDPDHFDPRYFGKGFRWQLPDLETSEKGYRMAREVFQAGGRQVLDATIGGKLTVFPKVGYETLF
jgi:hypothetical protein